MPIEFFFQFECYWTNKIDRHNITELLLKAALNTITWTLVLLEKKQIYSIAWKLRFYPVYLTIYVQMFLVKAITVIMCFMYMGDLCVYIDIFIFILHCFYLRSQSELTGYIFYIRSLTKIYFFWCLIHVEQR